MGWFENLAGGLFPGTFQTQADFNNKVGMQAAQQSQQQANAQAQQLMGTYNQYTGQASQALGNMADYARQAAGAYGTLQGYGAQDRNAYMNALSTYLPQYANAAGLPGSAGQSPYGVQNPYAVSPTQQPGGALALAGANAERSQRNPGGNPYAAGAQQGRTAQPNLSTGRAGEGANAGVNPTGTITQPSSAATAQAGGQESSFDPYALTPAQQVQLNAQVDQHNNAMQSAIANYRAGFAARGLAPPPEGEALIKEHFTSLGEQAKASFTENARQQREAAAMNMLQMFMPLGQQAASLQQAYAGGLGNVGGMFGNVAQGYGGIASGALGGAQNEQSLAMNAQQQWQQQAQEQAARHQAGWNAWLNLGGAALGGAFRAPVQIPQLPTGTGTTGGGGGVTGFGPPSSLSNENAPGWAYGAANTLASSINPDQPVLNYNWGGPQTPSVPSAQQFAHLMQGVY